MSKLHGNRIEVGTISTSNRNSLSNVNGHLIYNTDTNLLEYYNPAGWQQLGDASPNSKSDYPTPSGSTTVFTSAWPGSPSNLPTSDSNSTWTAPVSTTKARVIVIGSGAGHPSSYSSRGRGGVVDALINVEGGSSYKVIVGEAGNYGYATGNREGRGANGCGGSPGVDSNDVGTAGAGSAFFYGPPSANSDSSMFPKGVLIAGGGGGGGNNPGPVNSGSGPQSPDPIGGFNGISRSSGIISNTGEGGVVGGKGGRIWANYEPGDGLTGPQSARGEGGASTPDGYPSGTGNYQAGGGGGAGAGGGSHAGTGEDAPEGRGGGYGSLNSSGAGRGGNYPMRGGNGFTYQGVHLGGGGGGSHGTSSGAGGWGGGGGTYYNRSGGAGGSGAWGYIGSEVSISALPSSGPPAIPINGGSVGGNTPCPTSAGREQNNGAVIIMT